MATNIALKATYKAGSKVMDLKNIKYGCLLTKLRAFCKVFYRSLRGSTTLNITFFRTHTIDLIIKVINGHFIDGSVDGNTPREHYIYTRTISKNFEPWEPHRFVVPQSHNSWTTIQTSSDLLILISCEANIY